MTAAQPDAFPRIQFSLQSAANTKFAPRMGKVFLQRISSSFSIPTPNLLTSTSRGVIPHLSRDHHNRIGAIRWINIPFESFLDRTPPIPTLQSGKDPIHTFLGFRPDKHVLSMTIRDPADGRDMPPNGNNHISACCLRGVRKITPTEWRSYVLACQPDVVVALPDIPFTRPPYSQKRLTKAIDRTIRWLADMLRPIPLTNPVSDASVYRPNVLVHMAGGTSILARRVFSDSLSEKLYGKEAEQVAPLRSLDEGVIGYNFDLVPLRLSFKADVKTTVDDVLPSDDQEYSSSSFPGELESVLQDMTPSVVSTEQLLPLIHASLESLPTSRLRVVNTAASPHEMLRLIQSAGIDLFDAHFAQRAAQIGIALDFAFPVPDELLHKFAAATPRCRDNGKLDIGHNLYDSRYSLDFSCFASCFSPASNARSTSGVLLPMCPCLACSPISPGSRICHGLPDLEGKPESESSTKVYRPCHTRAYIHHLLHTHEMSAHSLLAMHNLTTLDTFFTGVRKTIAASESGNDVFDREVKKFFAKYDEDMVVFQEASVNWRDVDLARGKGRLEREKKKQALMGDADGSSVFVEDE